MRIAIVEDIATERKLLKDRLDGQLSRLALEAEISAFSSGTAFLPAAREEQFDLVFLDIYLEQENGVDTAKELRLFDPDCILVFLTTSTDHALDGFRVRAFHYLVKPYTDGELTALFDEIIKRFPVPDRYIEVNTADGPVRLRFQEILYAEHYRHQIYIYRTNGQKTVTRQTFCEFTVGLTDRRFFRCSRGVLVNLEYAEDFDGADFILKSGQRIAVSRDLAKTARQTFCDFLFETTEIYTPPLPKRELRSYPRRLLP